MAVDESMHRAGLATGKRPPLAFVCHDTAEVDWSQWYLTDEDDMGEGFEQGEIIRLLLQCISEWAREQGWRHRLWAADQFFAWRADHPLVRVSPDVYLLDNPPPAPRPASWQTWLPDHHPPSLAIEIVSSNWRKDYEDNPAKYWQLGCPELVIFDPDAAVDPQLSQRVPIQRYVRGEDGAYIRTHAGSEPAYVDALGCYLVSKTMRLDSDGQPVARLRLARDSAGEDLVPSLAEARASEAEARQREAEARQREAEARRAAEARVAELEAQLRAQK